MGAILSYLVGLPLSTAVSRSARGELGAVPGGGHPKQEGGLGIGGVSGPCHFSVYHLSLLPCGI